VHDTFQADSIRPPVAWQPGLGPAIRRLASPKRDIRQDREAALPG